MVSYILVGLGVILLAFGVLGVRAPEDIVAKQHAEGMTAFADAPIDDETRVRVTRYVAAGCLVIGVGFVLAGIGAF